MNCISRGGCYLVNSLCDVQEENHLTKERYQASWISLVIETRPQYRQTLSDKNCIGKESYEQQQVVHFIVERNLNQTLKLRSRDRDMTEHQLPILQKIRGRVKEENTGEFSKQKREIERTGEDHSKPVQTNFKAVSLMPLPREMSLG
ncbi:hypothetical protein NL108_000076 [Boleophthalmus pectinirostris]|uniref:telethonin n=1 Tax=Boleophthalmus pectinirostris TaxID=150288 RepID=UPI000A1C6F71|nr:telethonin [Boleophthalmus pectinirostris]KAJ0065847.1 hypothetical protein NL108_000076 [Boleophthalmus pectinirostris]